MTTNNIVSTPNITGNIGSCESKNISTVSGREGFFTEQIVNTVTNSCTGEVKEYYSWQFTTGAGITGFVFIAVVIGIMLAILSSDY